MTTAIIAEKPSIARYVHPFLGVGGDHLAAYAHPFISLNSNFDYPRGLKWSDYPAVLDVRYGSDVIRRSSFERGVVDEDLLAEIRACDRVILVRDASPSSALACQLGLLRIYPEGLPEGRVHDVALTSHAPEKLAASAEAGLRTALSTHGLDPDAYRPAEIKRRFDYNFNLNSFAVLGEVMRAVGATGPALTKVHVQTLYFCRDIGPEREGNLTYLMQRWKGTGRYVDPHVQLGSASSQAGAVETLERAGLLDREGTHHRAPLALTDKGRRLLDLLHPDCRDPDLPFRIEEWSRLSHEEAYPKVDRYIRTFFGKQKRFAGARLSGGVGRRYR